MPEWFETWWPVLIVVVGALWAAYTYFGRRRREDRKDAEGSAKGTGSVAADRGSVAAGRDITGSTLPTNRPPDDPAA